MPSTPAQKYPPVKLPHPYLTAYQVQTAAETDPSKLVLRLENQPSDGKPLPQPLHSDSLSWLDVTLPSKETCPPDNDNTPWARACRSPSTVFDWANGTTPSLGQIWNVVHAIYLAHPTYEYFRLTLTGDEKKTIRNELLFTGLGIEHPQPWDAKKKATWESEEILILRNAFWQGCGLPSRPSPHLGRRRWHRRPSAAIFGTIPDHA